MRHRFLLFCLFLGMLAGVWACGEKASDSSGHVTRAFYRWSSAHSDAKSDSLMAHLDVKRLYIHFFDVDVDAPGAAPYPITWYYDVSSFPRLDSVEVVPTVFITNQTFAQISDTSVADLANRVHKKINSIINSMGYVDPDNEYPRANGGMRDLFRRDSLREAARNRIHEIQFDCDWTPSTKDKYFLFLKKIKAKFPDKIVSSTIRLYGYKYPEKAGVPPVEKGMLMCYNAGDLRSMNTSNSIFNKDEILDYLDTEKPYPLPLDYALPIFEWCAVYRDNKLIALLPTEQFEFACSDYWCPFEREENSSDELPIYRAKQEHTIGYSDDAQLIKVGDVVKVERPNLSDVASVAHKLGKSNTNPKPVLTLFHFEYNNVKVHEKAIQKIYDSF